jgi:hypothetical protein
MHVHCSACGTPLTGGGGFCAGCGLQLTAYAVPTPGPKHHSLFFWLVLTFGAIAVVSIGAGKLTETFQAPAQAAARAAAEATQAQQLTAQRALVDSLATPAAFQKRCGPARVLHGVSAVDTRGEDPADLQGATTLVYTRQGTTMDVLLLPHFPFHLQFREHLDGKVVRYEGYEGLVEMRCDKKGNSK